LSQNTLAPGCNVLTCDKPCGTVRRAIIKEAQQLCDAGAHYLWGTAGDTPTHSLTGVDYRPKATGMATPYKNPQVAWRDELAWRKAQKEQWLKDNPKADPTTFKLPYFAPANTLAVAAANCGVAGYFVCSGRCAHPDVVARGSKIVPPNDPDLLTFLKGIGGTADKTTQLTVDATPPVLSPRMVVATNEIPGLGSSDLRGKIVWGEACTSARHFDCIGFVNYCYIKYAQGFVQTAIGQWGAQMTAAKICKASDPVWPGDVVVRGNDHIGLCDGGLAVDGEMGPPSINVVQALQSSMGVTRNELYQPGNWTARLQVPCDKLIPK
jgi:hypothetical protein